MPIDLKKVDFNFDLNDTNNKKIYKPTYFHKLLTKTNSSRGLMNKYVDSIKENLKYHNYKKLPNDLFDNEISIKPTNKRDIIVTDQFTNIKWNQFSQYNIKESHTFDTSVYSNYKLLPIYEDTIKSSYTYKQSNVPKCINDINFIEIDKNKNTTLYAGYLIDSIKYAKYKSISSDDKVEIFRPNINLVLKLDKNTKKEHLTLISTDGYSSIPDILNSLKSKTNTTNLIVFNNQVQPSDTSLLQACNIFGFNADDKYIQTMLDKLSKLKISDILSKQAELNDKYFIDDHTNLMKLIPNNDNALSTMKHALKNAYHLQKNCESSLTDNDYLKWCYKIKYNTILSNPKQFSNYDFNSLISVNTRLSLTNQLSALSKNKNVYKFEPKTPTLQTNEKYSKEQLNIIHATEPYTVGVAGAGSGKSHTLLGRLKFLQQNEINLKNVLVTSFTNVAAQNILNRFNGEINSLTNASLFHSIYQTNFEQTLTENATLVNLLSTVSDTSKFMQSTPTMIETKNTLIAILKRLTKNTFQRVDPRDVTERLIFLLSERYDDVVNLLNATKRTTLTLEPIIIHAMLQQNKPIKFPQSLSNLDFIITDESQDTSAFEYVLLLQLAVENNAQLMIIGDANQTLYEFRNANPRFLNTIERSKTFKAYTMSINYRSEQPVLTFANEFLKILETNATAKIQLHANKLQKQTVDSFKDHIKLQNVEIYGTTNKDRETNLNEVLSNNANLTIWIKEQINNNNQIAIMAYKNRDTQLITQCVANIYKQITKRDPVIASTRNPTPNANTWLSRIASFNDFPELLQLYKTKHQLNVNDVIKNLNDKFLKLQSQMSSRYQNNLRSLQFPQEAINQLQRSNKLRIYLRDLNTRKISFNNFTGKIKMYLINKETYYNQRTRQLLTAKPTNYETADIVQSTIHSAKGLEFDSVICYFNEREKNATSQENLRLYGVALTRAKENEFIINNIDASYGSSQKDVGNELSNMFDTPMRTAYNRVIKSLDPTK